MANTETTRAASPVVAAKLCAMRGSSGSHTRSDAALAKAAQLRSAMDRAEGAEAVLMSQVAPTEGGGQQLRDVVTALGCVVIVAAEDERVRRELVQHLPAGTARRSDRRGRCGDGDRHDVVSALRHRGEQRRAFGTHAEAEGRVLDVAGTHEPAVRSQQCSADG